MAVWLSLRLSQGTPNVAARTTTVSATLTIHYNGGSYDGTQPSGEITIDGQSFPFVKNFNYAGVGQGAATQGTGSTSITVTATVSYGSSSSRTVYASASFSRASGGASEAITLKSISSGGSSGGDSGGDDDGEEWEEGGSSGGSSSTGFPYNPTLVVAVDEHCKIECSNRNYGSITITKNGRYTFPSVSPVTFTFVFTADEGYELGVCSINGISCEGTGTLEATNGEYQIVATAIPVDDGSGDSGETEYPYRYTLKYVIGEHCKVEVYNQAQLPNTVTKSKTITYMSANPYQYKFVFIPDEGYKLRGCSVNGLACDGSVPVFLLVHTGTYEIVASAVPEDYVDGVVRIGNGTEYAAFQCFIDNGTEYDAYECYIDNGTSWDLVGEM